MSDGVGGRGRVAGAPIDAATGGAGLFRLGVVGAGRMGLTHLEAIRGSTSVVVGAVVDPDGAALDGLAGEGLELFGDVDELISAGAVDGVIVAAPTDMHLALVRRLLTAGIPVLCEKPCGLDVEEVEACTAAADAAGVPLGVAYWRRFVPELVDLRARIAAGAFGALLAVHCYQWDQLPPADEFRDRSGGIFVDMGVHEFDQVRWLTGQEWESLDVAATRLGSRPDDPDSGLAVGVLDGGTTALLSLGRYHPAGDSCAVEVYGTHDTVRLPFLPPVGGDAVFAEALRLQAEDFARSVLGGPSTGATVADAVAALRLARLASNQITPAPPPAVAAGPPQEST